MPNVLGFLTLYVDELTTLVIISQYCMTYMYSLPYTCFWSYIHIILLVVFSLPSILSYMIEGAFLAFIGMRLHMQVDRCQ